MKNIKRDKGNPENGAGSGAEYEEDIDLNDEIEFDPETGEISTSVRLFEDDDDEPEHKSDNLDSSKPKTVIPAKVAQKYAGKTPEELLSIIYNQEKFIGKLSSKIGTVETDSADALKAKLIAKKKDLRELRDNLSGLDAVEEADEYQKIKNQIVEAENSIEALTETWGDALVRESTIQKAADTASAVANQVKQSYADEYGVEFDKDDWSEITTSAESLANGEEVNEDDIEAAIVKYFGKAQYHKIIAGSAKMKARAEISNAREKVVPSVADRTIKSSGKRVYNVKDLSNERILQLIDDPRTPQAVLDAIYKTRLGRK